MASANALRQRRSRAGHRQGLVVLEVEAHEHRLVGALLRKRRLSDDESRRRCCGQQDCDRRQSHWSGPLRRMPMARRICSSSCSSSWRSLANVSADLRVGPLEPRVDLRLCLFVVVVDLGLDPFETLVSGQHGHRQILLRSTSWPPPKVSAVIAAVRRPPGVAPLSVGLDPHPRLARALTARMTSRSNSANGAMTPACRRNARSMACVRRC